MGFLYNIIFYFIIFVAVAYFGSSYIEGKDLIKVNDCEKFHFR